MRLSSKRLPTDLFAPSPAKSRRISSGSASSAGRAASPSLVVVGEDIEPEPTIDARPSAGCDEFDSSRLVMNTQEVIMGIIQAGLELLQGNNSLSAEQKLAESERLILNTLSTCPTWSFIDVYRSNQATSIPSSELTPKLIWLAHQLSADTAFYLDQLPSELRLNDLRLLGIYLNSEIGLHIEKESGRLVLNCGKPGNLLTTAHVVSSPTPVESFTTVAHTHPTLSSAKAQFTRDIRKYTPGLEFVITAAGLIVYFDSGIIHNKIHTGRDEVIVLSILKYDAMGTELLEINTLVNNALIGQLQAIATEIEGKKKEPSKASSAAVEEDERFNPVWGSFGKTT